MADDVFHQLYYHLTWSAKGRQAAVPPELQEQVSRTVDEQVRAKGGTVVECSVQPDHVHVLVNLPPSVCLENLIPQVKRTCAVELNRDRGSRAPIWWDPGYGAVTVRKGELERVAGYVRDQAEIHANHRASRTLEAASQAHYEAMGDPAHAKPTGEPEPVKAAEGTAEQAGQTEEAPEKPGRDGAARQRTTKPRGKAAT